MEALLKHTDARRGLIFANAQAMAKPGQDGKGIVFEV
jgi:hypothetical protein